MHALPFTASLTDSLLAALSDAARQCVIKVPDSIPSVSWCTSQKGKEPPVDGWELFAISRGYMRPEDVFTIDGVTFHISQADQLRASGHILDWQQGIGLVQVEDGQT